LLALCPVNRITNYEPFGPHAYIARRMVWLSTGFLAMPESLNIHDISQEDATRAGAIFGALISGVLWSLQHESAGPVTLPIPRSGKQYVSDKEAADILEVRKTTFYKLAKRDDFPPKRETASGALKYLAAEIVKFKNKRRKA
jgi:predicted DNA-binding transcriptional regulator AlpA